MRFYLVGHLELLNRDVDLDGIGKGEDAIRTNVVGLKMEDLEGLVGLEGIGEGDGSVIVDLGIGEHELLEVGVVCGEVNRDE